MNNKTTALGVNIGGWLVLEKWMTPSVFYKSTAVNEYELSKTIAGQRAIKRHQDTFISEADFKWLQAHGVMTVRIPVGYWLFGDEAPYVDSVDRLDWAVDMAEKYNLQVLIDLHAAPGAQNAADHSGSGHPGLPVWLNDPSKQERTILALERLATRYYHRPAVWGIELLNEPLADRFGFRLIRFYRQAYKRLRKIARPGLYIVFSDGFKPLLLTGALRRDKKLPIAMDCHLYQCFSEDDKARTFTQHLKKVRRKRLLIRFLQLWQPVIVGEWSGVLPWTLLKDLSKQEQEQVRNSFTDHQLKAFENAQRHFYWNYKTEKKSAWNFRSVVEQNKRK